MLVKELIEKYSIEDKNIPNNILNIELEEEVSNFQKKELKDKYYSFTGEYSPRGYDGEELLSVSLIIDLTRIDDSLLNKNEDLLKTLSTQELSSLTNIETVTFIKTIKDNFYSHTTYNIFGGMVRIS